MERRRHLRAAVKGRWLVVLLLAATARLWLMPLGSSFWIDEIATVFVARHGSDHWSLAAVAPQAWASVYYGAARASAAVPVPLEIAYRTPSIAAMALLLFLISRLAMRLIHPRAGWFAVFACLALSGIDYAAADARPYAVGMCVAAIALLLLVRWMDGAQWTDALVFFLAAALLWRIHLLFWPFYIVLALYASVRLVRGSSATGWVRTLAVFSAVGLALVPVLLNMLPLLREAGAHVIVPRPTLRDLLRTLQWRLILICGVAAWLLHRRKRAAANPAPEALALIGGWWLIQPFALFAYSWLSGTSVFVPRYVSLALPGAALAATALASLWIPEPRWKAFAAVLGAGALITAGQWRQLWPRHHNSDWRAAAAAVNTLATANGTTVLCPSPFIEAKAPAWRPDYPLPGFLYAHLDVYPIRGDVRLLPFEFSKDAAPTWSPATRRIIVYGWDRQVWSWRDWLRTQPTAADWRERHVGPFADVDVVVFDPAK